MIFSFEIIGSTLYVYQFPTFKAKLIQFLLNTHQSGNDFIFKLFHTVNRKLFTFHYSLSLHSSVGITTGKRFNFVNRYQVEVTVDGVLQGTGSHSELQGLALSLLRQKTVDQTT